MSRAGRSRPVVALTLSDACRDRIDAIAALSGESRSACVERVFMREYEESLEKRVAALEARKTRKS